MRFDYYGNIKMYVMVIENIENYVNLLNCIKQELINRNETTIKYVIYT